jgi:hypothetical protein
VFQTPTGSKQSSFQLFKIKTLDRTAIVAHCGPEKKGPNMDPFDQLSSYIAVPMEDDFAHTAENGYTCGDPSCYCANPSDEIHASDVTSSALTYVLGETTDRLN